MSVEGKIALVTGASRGMGRAIALALGKAGALVMGTATTSEGVDRLDAMFAQANLEGKGYQVDVRREENVKVVLEDIQKRYGNPSIVINNAGIIRDNIALRMKQEQWDEVLETNLTGTFRIIKGCLRGMLKIRWGRIINLSSVVAFMGNAGQANYVASKAGVVGLTKALALEVAAYGITVNCIAPGFIDTDMTNQLDEKYRTMLIERIPVKRIGDPGEIAEAVLFLASSRASYITGETIHINGGLYME